MENRVNLSKENSIEAIDNRVSLPPSPFSVEIWDLIFSFIDDMPTLLSLMRVNKFFNERVKTKDLLSQPQCIEYILFPQITLKALQAVGIALILMINNYRNYRSSWKDFFFGNVNDRIINCIEYLILQIQKSNDKSQLTKYFILYQLIIERLFNLAEKSKDVHLKNMLDRQIPPKITQCTEKTASYFPNTLALIQEEWFSNPTQAEKSVFELSLSVNSRNYNNEIDLLSPLLCVTKFLIKDISIQRYRSCTKFLINTFNKNLNEINEKKKKAIKRLDDIENSMEENQDLKSSFATLKNTEPTDLLSMNKSKRKKYNQCLQKIQEESEGNSNSKAALSEYKTTMEEVKDSIYSFLWYKHKIDPPAVCNFLARDFSL